MIVRDRLALGDAICVGVMEWVAGVRVFVGMKPFEQVYSQIVEREQFRDTTKNDEGGNGEVHHATAIVSYMLIKVNGKKLLLPGRAQA
jgi:hypothetical protein